MRFHPRDETIHAEQWFPGTTIEGVQEGIDDRVYTSDGVRPKVCFVEIGSQRFKLDPGDWVIRDAKGRLRPPCNPSVFVMIYEPLPEGDVEHPDCRLHA